MVRRKYGRQHLRRLDSNHRPHPADLARRLGTGGEAERRVLEALALDEFRHGHLGRVELRRLLGFATRAKLDEFLTGHGVFGTYTADDLERDRRHLQKLGF